MAENDVISEGFELRSGETVVFRELPVELTYKLRQDVLRPDGNWEHISIPTDTISRHYGLVTQEGEAIAVVSTFVDPTDPDSGLRIRKFAVSSRVQGCGAGSILLKKIFGMAEKDGVSRCYLHSRLTAANFYQKCGMYPLGPVFVEAAHQHQLYEWRPLRSAEDESTQDEASP
eukprot:Protomagalhaensia_wolfi_Nauph_80__2901@NODE_298_length_2861_cov_180_339830_g222_i0_p3_GENE_NODE_298_length_2861_cov_180_339830_g222_i0NODE_298_length_2861_cov_180_339830_g222_i0_p3_ORF_typecomplete_len173_score21_21Acetyltransf_10/PF13673_7/3_7e14Acetyltransf_1/PF00583_25/6_5e11Acetyltransf_7/PF13508_7/6_6e06Acetyltransf_9/PF13527_7/0_00092Acetyltransf_9/PF13527_7/9_3e02NodA/PF02474_15/0_0038GNAT_acetyltr_2/PF13718_6/0_052_NODE_298_length_2861_cov_180_339830_g222_i012091727